MMASTSLTTTISRGLCVPSSIELMRQAPLCNCKVGLCHVSTAAASPSGTSSSSPSAVDAVPGFKGRRLLGGRGMGEGRSSLGHLPQQRTGWHLREGPSSQQVTFRARKTLNLPVKEYSLSIDEYLQNVERVVKITLPDSNRIQYIGKSTWRARLKPVEFFSVSATPFCDMKAWYEDRALRIFSNSLKLEFSNSSTTADDFNLKLSLAGSLRSLRPRPPPTQSTTPQTARNPQTAPQTPTTIRPITSPSVTSTLGTRTPTPSPPRARPAGIANRSVGAHLQSGRPGGVAEVVRLEGAVNLGLTVDLPMPLSLIPEQALAAVGDRILDSILSALQGSLLRGLLLDYATWCRESERKALQANGPAATAAGRQEPMRS